MPIIPKNNEEKNKKVVCTLNDLEKRKVVEHNALIQSVAKMQKTALKMFELAVSCIDTENPPKDNIIYLSKKELFSFFDVYLYVVDMTCCIVTLNDVVSLKLLKSKHIYNFL